MKKTIVFMILAACLSYPAFGQVVAPPSLMNFQGRLAKPDGTPVANGNYSIRFSLWTAASGGTEKWNQTVNPVTVRNGTFAVLLNVGTGPADLWNDNRWLEIKIGTAAALTPRQQLVSVAFALKANTVPDNAITSAKILNGTITGADIAAGTLTTDKFASSAQGWLLGGNAGTTASHFLGTTDNKPLELRVNNRRALRISYVENVAAAFRTFNILGGAEANSIGSGVVGATIAGGGNAGIDSTDLPNIINSDYGFLGGGYYNLIDTNAVNSVIGGGFQNNINIGASNSAIVGGEGNMISAAYAFIGGGQSNQASGMNAFVGGGVLSGAGGANSVVGGGNNNLALAQYAAVLGGNSNIASGLSAFVGGGSNNRATLDSAFVGGGSGNQATRPESTISGGKLNSATGDQATIGGGESNAASAAYATVGGGVRNRAVINSAFIGGGVDNIASGPLSFIGGGLDNSTYGRNSVIAGGSNNVTDGEDSSIGGGNRNSASGLYATVPGGYYNSASGIGSFAAGVRAVANSSGSFVWADNHDVDFAASAANQFAIRAYGGMVLETGQNAWLYTSSTAGEKNRYFMLLNSPQTVSASGLKAGGILCADDFGYANPTKNNVIVKGGASIGYNFTDASYKLIVNGATYSLGGYAGSDARWKSNIHSLPNALDTVLNLRGVSFAWKPTDGMNFPDGKQIGFIAQEVEKVLPELVSTDSKGYKAVAYANIVPVLVEAMKQQQQQIQSRDERILRLEAQLTELAQAVSKLQANQK